MGNPFSFQSNLIKTITAIPIAIENLSQINQTLI